MGETDDAEGGMVPQEMCPSDLRVGNIASAFSEVAAGHLAWPALPRGVAGKNGELNQHKTVNPTTASARASTQPA